MCLQQPIPRSKSLYHHFQPSLSPRATLRCRSFPPYSGFDRLYTNEKPQQGSDEFNPSDSLLPPSGPHANTNLATAEVTPLEWIFFLNSIGLEISSAAVDQVSSPLKPQYAQISLWMAIANVVLCIWELIHGRMKDKDASSNSMVYRSLPDILGWGLAVIQCVWSAVQYYYHHQHTSNPIKLSPVALYFIVCLMVFKYKWWG